MTNHLLKCFENRLTEIGDFEIQWPINNISIKTQHLKAEWSSDRKDLDDVLEQSCADEK